MNAQATNRKTSKAALKEAVQSFFYSLEWLTGGTAEETRRQADHGIKTLEERAATVAALAANPAKLCAADTWLMERALVDVPARVETYRTRYVGQYEAWKAEQAAKRAEEERKDRAAFEVFQALEALTASAPSNIIPFPSR